MRRQQRTPTINPKTGFSRATEWLGRLAALISALLLILVLIAIRSGLEVQQSTRTIDDNLRQSTQYFDERADLGAPARARNQLTELKSVLTELNSATAADVDQLAAMLPDMQTLVTASQNDETIADQLRSVASSLQGAAGSLQAISNDADAVVVTVDDRLLAALNLVDLLNTELRRTTTKLAPIPAQET